MHDKTSNSKIARDIIVSIHFRPVVEILLCLLRFLHFPCLLHLCGQQLNNSVQEDAANSYGPPEQLGGVALAHETCTLMMTITRFSVLATD